ncbi:MAG: PDZ domain-containing protein [Verrucomicrobiae bacterium]|nr:PDZ domain-containing protein [Verrucomicrobiae bacterium]
MKNLRQKTLSLILFIVLPVLPLMSAPQKPVEEVKDEVKMITILGVETSRISPALRNQVDIPDGVGLTITHVAEDTGAAKAGLQEYDIILKVDDQVIINQEQLSVFIRSRKPGDKVKVEIMRKGKKQDVTVELVEREAPKPRPFGRDWTMPKSHGLPFGDFEFNFDSDEFRKHMEDFTRHAEEMGNKAMQFIPEILIEREDDDGSTRVTSVGRGPHRITVSREEYAAQLETTGGEKNYRISRKQEGKDEEVLYEGGEPDEAAVESLPEEARALLKKLDDSKGIPWKNLEDLKKENIRVIINTGKEEARLVDDGVVEDI